MIEILLSLVALVLLAKRSPKRKYRRYIRGNVDQDLAMTGLAANTLVTEDLQDVVTDTTFVTSIIATWAIHQYTPSQGTGPFNIYVAHSDYTDAEIEEWIENATNWNMNDLVSQEIARRKIKLVGQIYASGGQLVTDVMSMSEGRKVRTKLNWLLGVGTTLQIGAYNTGASAVATTTPTLQVNGHCNLWPR